jgi:hypothetical protein
MEIGGPAKRRLANFPDDEKPIRSLEHPPGTPEGVGGPFGIGLFPGVPHLRGKLGRCIFTAVERFYSHDGHSLHGRNFPARHAGR